MYGKSEDATLRAAVRQGKTAGEFWAESAAYLDRWEKVKKQIEDEQFKGTGTAPPTRAPTQSAEEAQKAQDKHQLDETIRRGVFHSLAPKSTEWFRARAYQEVRRYIRLIAEPELSTTLKTEILNSNLKDIKGVVGRKCVAILFDSTCHGEAASNPMFRLPPLSESRVRKLLTATLGARSSDLATPSPMEGDVYMLLDGGRGTSTETMLLCPFRNTADSESTSRRSSRGQDVHVKRVSLVFDEASILQKRERQKSDNVTQTSAMFVVTASGLKVPRKDYNLYKGFSCRGDAISPIVLPMTAQFLVQAKDKKAVWGPHRLAVGGPAQDDAASATGETLEPVCYHGLPVTFYKDVFQAHSVIGICDLTVGGATATEAALALKVPYFGVCPTEVHCLKTMDFLADRMLAMMADQTSNFYDPELTKREDPKGEGNTPTKPTPTPAPMPAFPKDTTIQHTPTRTLLAHTHTHTRTHPTTHRCQGLEQGQAEGSDRRGQEEEEQAQEEGGDVGERFEFFAVFHVS